MNWQRLTLKPVHFPGSGHAAQGWLELGNITEANEELEKIEASLHSHPDVLEDALMR